MHLSPLVGVFLCLLLGICGHGVPVHADDLFRDQIAPLLQHRCLGCHNDAHPKGDFSVQRRASFFDPGHIERGQADESHLLELVTPEGGKARMPKDAPPLTTEEIALLREWIDRGANSPPDWELAEPQVDDFEWWSYQPLERPSVPGSASSWPRTAVDRFVLRRLQAAGLAPSPEANRRTLIRRVTYDLTGLPPTPQQVAQFIEDEDPQAYERLVDRLLSSPHYGERWARHWLDVVKYADTCGYDKDKLRPQAWPYRDYVIRSFNEDKPYAQFVQEQIAGDVLFPNTPDGILGLGFIAAGPWDFIGHVEVSEAKLDGKVARNLDRDDMVTNTLNTFCSVTVQCARCHHHKFDPITQKDYYGLQAIFAAVDRANRVYEQDPKIEARRAELEGQRSSAQAELETVQAEIAAAGGTQLSELQRSLEGLAGAADVKKTAAFGYHSGIAGSADTPKWVMIDLGRTVSAEEIRLHPCHDDFAGIGAGFGLPEKLLVEVRANDQEDWESIEVPSTRGKNLVPTVIPLALQVRFVRVRAPRLAERQNDFIFALAEVEVRAQGENMAIGADVSAADSIEAPPRWARANLTDGQWATYRDPKRAGRLAELQAKHDALLAAIHTPQRKQRQATTEQRVNEIEEALRKLPQGKLVYAAATDFPAQGNFRPTEGKMRPIHVLHRGNIRQPGAPAAPRLLPLTPRTTDLASDLHEGERRAALAKWLTSPEHPLVWRSIANRVWQYHFGQGIVRTPNDFGRMGALPTHPELLDWLASELRDGRQTLKSLHRLLVTSAVYRQASHHDSDRHAVDGGNQWLWRMPRRRLSAEEIRDSVLAVSGALQPTMGGAGFYLFELEKTAHSPHYEYHKFDPRDANSHRRTVYRFVVRSQPDPWMSTLDCADSSQSTPKRSETLTSLQALSLLNSKFNLVMAEEFADRLRQEAPTLEGQVERALSLTTQRASEETERSSLVAYARQHGLPNLCRLLFNLSEFVFVD